jgi:hypothetical protein
MWRPLAKCTGRPGAIMGVTRAGSVFSTSGNKFQGRPGGPLYRPDVLNLERGGGFCVKIMSFPGEIRVSEKLCIFEMQNSWEFSIKRIPHFASC